MSRKKKTMSLEIDTADMKFFKGQIELNTLNEGPMRFQIRKVKFKGNFVEAEIGWRAEIDPEHPGSWRRKPEAKTFSSPPKKSALLQNCKKILVRIFINPKLFVAVTDWTIVENKDSLHKKILFETDLGETGTLFPADHPELIVPNQKPRR